MRSSKEGFMRRLLSLLIPMLAFACSDSTSPDVVIVGTWNLETVNGNPLPFTLPGTGEVVTAEAFTIQAAGRFTITTTFRVTSGGNVTSETIPDAGAYVVSGSTVTFTYDSDGSQDIATVSGNTFTLTDIGEVWTYRRN
jgi:hypothetical protein